MRERWACRPSGTPKEPTWQGTHTHIHTNTQTLRDRKGTPKKFGVNTQGQKRYPKEVLSDKDVAELSGELSGAICLKTLVLIGNDR